MSPTPRNSPEVCTHERRPGTTVCLHCRHAARLEARTKRKRLMLRGSAVAIVLATLGAAGVLGATALRGRNAAANDPKPLQVVANTAVVVPVRETRSGETRAASGPAVPQGEITQAIAATPTPAPATPRPAPPAPTIANANASANGSTNVLRPVLPPGESPLRDGVVAQRSDSEVVLSFDTPDLRTRIPEKFESFVRSTLPEVYGAPADSALTHIPSGDLTKQGSLLTELPLRGMRVPLKDGSSIVLYPETRPGRDGPLVIRYRVTVARQGETQGAR